MLPRRAAGLAAITLLAYQVASYPTTNLISRTWETLFDSVDDLGDRKAGHFAGNEVVKYSRDSKPNIMSGSREASLGAKYDHLVFQSLLSSPRDTRKDRGDSMPLKGCSQTMPQLLTEYLRRLQENIQVLYRKTQDLMLNGKKSAYEVGMVNGRELPDSTPDTMNVQNNARHKRNFPGSPGCQLDVLAACQVHLRQTITRQFDLCKPDRFEFITRATSHGCIDTNCNQLRRLLRNCERTGTALTRDDPLLAGKNVNFLDFKAFGENVVEVVSGRPRIGQ